MDDRTIARYDADAAVYAARPRLGDDDDRARAFAATIPSGVRLDAGCGTGLHLSALGSPVIGVDASRSMLAHARSSNPATPLAAADLASLPLRAGTLAGAWANKSLQHLPEHGMALALGELHRCTVVGGRLHLQVFEGDQTIRSSGDSDLPDRLFTLLTERAVHDLLEGAGYDQVEVAVETTAIGPPHPLAATATRARSLADSVGPGMRLLLCGLNPSLYAAEAGVAFARPGNRFWPALRAAGLTTVDRDARRLLALDDIGLTDLVKRATVAAAELTEPEYRHGIERVARLCERLRPAAVCFVGLAGWRAAVDRRAVAGWQPEPLGGAPVYVMPSTSGLNAHASAVDLAQHLRTAGRGPGRRERHP